MYNNIHYQLSFCNCKQVVIISNGVLIDHYTYSPFVTPFPRAYPVQEYPAENEQCASIMLMIMNVLDRKVAQFPHELVTYGGNGQVFSNWAQVR